MADSKASSESKAVGLGEDKDSKSSSRSSTPVVSNPSTPRADLSQEVRATPPLPAPPVQRSIPGHAIPASMTPQTSAAFTSGSQPASAPGVSMLTPPQAGMHSLTPHQPQSKYSSLLAVIEDMGRDIRPTYSGNRTSSERLKRSIVHARILVRECLMECERSART